MSHQKELAEVLRIEVGFFLTASVVSEADSQSSKSNEYGYYPPGQT